MRRPTRALLGALLALLCVLPARAASADFDDDDEPFEAVPVPEASTKPQAGFAEDEAGSNAVSFILEHWRGGAFKPRSRVSLKLPTASLLSTSVTLEPKGLAIAPLDKFPTEEYAADALYKIRVPANLRTGGGRQIVASVRMCALATSGMREQITLLVDGPSGNVLSVSLEGARKACKPDAKPAAELQTSIRVAYPAEGVKPITDPVLLGLTQEHKPVEQPSFFRKYWYFILPFVVMVCLNSAGQAAQGGDPGAGGGRPAGRPAGARRAR